MKKCGNCGKCNLDKADVCKECQCELIEEDGPSGTDSASSPSSSLSSPSPSPKDQPMTIGETIWVFICSGLLIWAFLAKSFWVWVLVILIWGITFSIESAKKTRIENEKEKNRVLKTKIITTFHNSVSRSLTKTGSAMSRGIIGGAFLGPLGFLAGFLSGDKKTTETDESTTMFLVYYKDGHRERKTVKNESALFDIYIDKLEI